MYLQPLTLFQRSLVLVSTPHTRFSMLVSHTSPHLTLFVPLSPFCLHTTCVLTPFPWNPTWPCPWLVPAFFVNSSLNTQIQRFKAAVRMWENMQRLSFCARLPYSKWLFVVLSTYPKISQFSFYFLWNRILLCISKAVFIHPWINWWIFRLFPFPGFNA